MNTKEIKQMQKESTEMMDKLRQIVDQTMEEENRMLESLMHPPEEKLSRAQRISDRVARFGGSWNFIISFFFVLVGWILFNTFAPNRDDFDPYPFILMNLVLSCIAALQAPVIMMSQNRKEEKDRARSENDYMVNLKAELQIRSLHQKVDLLLQEEIRTLYNSQEAQLKLLMEMDSKLDKVLASEAKKGDQ